ncbi:MAG: hypothetical protein ABIN48_11400 [Ginsengibacter sp.]
MAKEEKINNPIMGSDELKDETTKRQGSKINPKPDLTTHVAALSAQQKKEAEEALAKAKEHVKNADIPARLPGDIQRQTM